MTFIVLGLIVLYSINSAVLSRGDFSMLPGPPNEFDEDNNLPICHDIDAPEKLSKALAKIDRVRELSLLEPYHCIYNKDIEKFDCEEQPDKMSIVDVFRILVKDVETCSMHQQAMFHGTAYRLIKDVNIKARKVKDIHVERAAYLSKFFKRLREFHSDASLLAKKQLDKMQDINEKLKLLSKSVHQFREDMRNFDFTPDVRKRIYEAILEKEEEADMFRYRLVLAKHLLLRGWDAETIYSMACCTLFLLFLSKRVLRGHYLLINVLNTTVFVMRAYFVHQDLISFASSFVKEIIVGTLVLALLSFLWDVTGNL